MGKNQTNKLKAFIYARTSQDSIADSGKENKVSINEQIKECQALAEEQDIEVIDVYIDRNLSSVTYPTGFEQIAEDDDVYKAYMNKTSKPLKDYYRPALGKIMESLNKVDYILVRDETRLMRPLIHSQLLSKIYGKIQVNNVKIYCCLNKRIIDPNNFTDAFMSTVISMTEVNSMLEKIEASRRSLIEKRNSGYLYHSMNMFGFTPAGQQKVEINNEQSKIIKLIYNMVLHENKSIGQVVRCLNQQGISTHKGKEWTHQGVLKVVRRLEYTGNQYDTEGNIIKCIPLEGKGVIELSQWKKMQRLLNANKKFPKSESTEIRPLTGLCYCAYCGRRLKVAKSKQFDNNTYNTYYECRHGSVHQEATLATVGCRMVRIREQSPKREAAGGFNPKLARNGLREVVLPLLYQHLLKSKKDELLCGEFISELEDAKAEESKLLENLNMFSDMLANGDVDNDAFKVLVKRHAEKRDLNKAKTRDLEEKINKANENVYDRDEFILMFFDIQSDNIDAVTYRKMARSIIKRIEVAAYSIRIYFSDDDYIDIERVPITSSRALPNTYIYADIRDDFGVASMVTVHYYYKSFFKKNATKKDLIKKVIYENRMMTVVTHGYNPKPHEYIKNKNQTKRLSEMKPIPEYVMNVFESK